MKLRTGQMTVTTASDGQKVVRLGWDKENKRYDTVLTGEEARRFLAKYDRRTNALTVLFLPISAVFWIIVGIHNGTEWLLRKFMGEK